jgi:uncharacterized protein (TIGR03435 family)
MTNRISIAMATATAIVLSMLNTPAIHSEASSGTQVPDTPLPTFEVASVKKHPPDNGAKMGITMGGGPDVSRYRASNMTAKMLIATAYGVNEFQISGAPSWVSSEHWDIDAKMEDSLAAQLQKLPLEQQRAQQALMIRSLLLDRFKLQVTRSAEQGNVLALVVAKGGSKLKEVPPPDSQGPTEMAPGGRVPGQRSTLGPGQAGIMLRATGLAMLSSNAVPVATLVNQLSTMLGKQVVDQTGLKATYQYTLQFSPQGLGGVPADRPDADNNSASIFTALQEQLGLRLESTKGLVDTIVIDHIEEPSAN